MEAEPHTLSVNGHFDRNPIVRTGAFIKYGVWVTECGEWIHSYGVVVGKDYKGFVLSSAVVILVREVFPYFVRIR